MRLRTLLLTLFASAFLVAAAAAQTGAATDCGDWQDCRQRTTDALARQDYEAAHDLAWRAVQKSPKRNNELLYLLARAQCLSGRPHDALVMLERLVDSGVAANARTDEDFRRTRELPGWAALDARMSGTPAPAADESSLKAAPATTTTATTPAKTDPIKAPTAAAAATSTAGAAPTPAVDTASEVPAPKVGVVEEAARFMTRRFAAGGLAYDVVSRRFLFGDRDGRKLITAGDGFDHAVDFVRADSAGFHQVMGIEIDVRRGDLWVASAAGDGAVAALHKVQLISGRPLKTFDAPAETPMRLVDLAVTTEGAIVVLDGMGGHLLELKPRGEQLTSLLAVNVASPTSLALTGAADVAYVAHAEGISRVDLKTRRVTAVTAAKDVPLAGFERIRWYRDGLVGIVKAADGTRRVLRLQLNAAGRRATKATVIDATVPSGDGSVFATISGDQLSYLVSASAPEGTDADLAEVIVYRVALR